MTCPLKEGDKVLIAKPGMRSLVVRVRKLLRGDLRPMFQANLVTSVPVSMSAAEADEHARHLARAAKQQEQLAAALDATGVVVGFQDLEHGLGLLFWPDTGTFTDLGGNMIVVSLTSD